MTFTLANLKIVPREAWGLGLSPDWPLSPEWAPITHTPQFLIVHHTVTNNKQGNADTIRAIWRYHAQTQGWGDIRYHYLIGQDGVIYEGRWSGNQTSNIFVEGGQSMDSNTNKIGIVLLGQFEPSVSFPAPGEPTPEALQSLVKLLGTIAYQLNLDPLGETYHTLEKKSYPVIGGHRDHYRTTCPGGNLYAQIVDIREDVATEVQRLHQNQGEPERMLSLHPEANQMAWGKSTWPNLLWGNENLFSGAWWQTQYAALIEIALPQDVIEGQLTGLDLILSGQNAKYLRDTDGSWQAVILASPLRGQTAPKVRFEVLQNAPSIATFLPSLSWGDLQPGQKVKLSLDAADLPTLQQNMATGYLSIRLQGPNHGRRLFAWSGATDQNGPQLQLRYRLNPAPKPDLSDVMVKDIAFKTTPQGQIRLAALVINIGQVSTPDGVALDFYVEGQWLSSSAMEPLPPGKSRGVQAEQTFRLRGLRNIMVIVDQPNRMLEEQEGNNILTKAIDFGTEQDYLADMIIRAINLGQAAPFVAGQALIFEAIVKNIGASLTSNVVGVAFFVDNRYITFGTIEALAGGETQTVKAIAPWQAEVGQHTLLAIVDDINRFEEKSESNNRFEIAFEVLPPESTALPDSTLEALAFQSNSAGQIILTATVSNVGQAPTPDIVGVGFFVDDRYITHGITQPMAPGSTATIQAVQPLLLKGPHKITAIVNDVNRYEEISTQNNILTQFITFP